jgi:hypothetical protein
MWQYKEDTLMVTIEVLWSVFNIKIQDIRFASTEDHCALQEHDQHAPRASFTAAHVIFKTIS